MMPAIRAAASTSPLGALPSMISASVAGSITTRPPAVAWRSVTALSETSTIRARPSASRWVSRVFAMLAPDCRLARLVQDRPGRRLDIALPHQALADQEGVDPRSRQPREVVGGADAALGNRDRAGRQQRRQPLA